MKNSTPLWTKEELNLHNPLDQTHPHCSRSASHPGSFRSARLSDEWRKIFDISLSWAYSQVHQVLCRVPDYQSPRREEHPLTYCSDGQNDITASDPGRDLTQRGSMNMDEEASALMQHFTPPSSTACAISAQGLSSEARASTSLAAHFKSRGRRELYARAR